MLQQFQERLDKFGLVPSSRDWVVKALDPACTLASPGIPDTSLCPVMRPEYTAQLTIAAPSVSTSQWDCMLVIPPGNVQSLMYAAGPAGTNFAQQALPSGATVGYIGLEPYVDFPGTNAWTYQNLSGAPPYPAPTQVNYSIRGPQSMPLTFRHQFKSVTVELIAAAVNDQGDVYAAQYPTDFRSRGIPQPLGTATSSATGAPIMAMTSSIALPMNETDLCLSSRAPYVGKAKDGVYMPIKLMGPTLDYADVSYNGGVGIAQVATPPENGTITPQFSYNNIQFPQNFQPVVNDSGTAIESCWINAIYNTITATCDTGYDKAATGVIIFRGLAAAGGSGFTSSLMVKVIAGLEVCPRPTTPDRVYMKPAAPYDPRALDAYFAISGTLPAAYPARYNSLGAILPILSSVAARLWPAVQAGGRAFLRQVSGEEKAAERVPFDAPRARVVTRARSTLRAASVASKQPSKSARRKRRGVPSKVVGSQ